MLKSQKNISVAELRINNMYYKLLRNDTSLVSQLTDADTIYEIRDRIVINQPVTIPPKSVLRFNGGMFAKGSCDSHMAVITASDCKIESPLVKIFENIKFSGDIIYNDTFQIEWFVGTYETSFISDSTNDSSEELNQAFNSGVKNIHFNSGRYYPITQPIIINGNLDITGETRYLDNSTFYLKQPCIYGAINGPLFIYNFYNSPMEDKKTRVNIDGLHFYYSGSYENNLPTLSSYTQPTSEDIASLNSAANTILNNIDYHPIVLFNNIGDDTLWGLHINVNITSANRGLTLQIPNWTGLEINADSAAISYIEIHGYISMVFRAYYIHASLSTWITDTKIYGNSRCAIGGDFQGGYPTRNFGTHQTIPVFPDGCFVPYFKARAFTNYGYVWDIRVRNAYNYLWPCYYIAEPYEDTTMHRGFLFDETQANHSVVSIESPTDVFYPNLLADCFKYTNGMTDIVVNTLIVCKDRNGNIIDYGSQTVEEHLQFKRYLFPEHLMRSDNLAWNAVFHSDAGFSNNAESDKTYTYRVTITLSGQTMRMAYQDKPSLYFSPIRSQEPFIVTVTYKDSSDVLIKQISFKYHSGDADSIASSYYYGRYIKIQDLFTEDHYVSQSKTIIEFEQTLQGQTLIQRPVFFIPNYHSYKIIRAGDNSGMVQMTAYDIGETYFHSVNGQLWWDGNRWIEYDKANAGIDRSGIYANRPSTGIYVGFRYFCTSGAKVQGISMPNIVIYYTGTNWVDALGRIVTA